MPAKKPPAKKTAAKKPAPKKAPAKKTAAKKPAAKKPPAKKTATATKENKPKWPFRSFYPIKNRNEAMIFGLRQHSTHLTIVSLMPLLENSQL